MTSQQYYRGARRAEFAEARATRQARHKWRLLRFARNDILFFMFVFLLSACSINSGRVTPTPVIQIENENPTKAPDEALTPTLEPFRFYLPTPGAAPVSGWRPPLYPIPWAVSPYDHFYFARPIAADQVNWPLADYRYGGVFTAHFVHTGVDIDAPYGTPILAAGPGTIVWANWGLLTEDPGNRSDDYGEAVVIRMDFGFENQQLYTVYAHMSQIVAVIGQHVNTGDVIGLVGQTGHATGPHVHFEVRLGYNSFYDTYNPELWMAPPQGWGVLVGNISDNSGMTLQQLEVYVQNIITNKTLIVKTYGPGPVNHDPYYDENLTLSDLPAGEYKVYFNYEGKIVQDWMRIYPGQVTYFTYRGATGFNWAPPPAPTKNIIPPTPPQPTP
jgi:murein DD-endopeptidase MepM/ murein hydrolase activator NlpD